MRNNLLYLTLIASNDSMEWCPCHMWGNMEISLYEVCQNNEMPKVNETVIPTFKCGVVMVMMLVKRRCSWPRGRSRVSSF